MMKQAESAIGRKSSDQYKSCHPPGKRLIHLISIGLSFPSDLVFHPILYVFIKYLHMYIVYYLYKSFKQSLTQCHIDFLSQNQIYVD